MDKSEIKQRLQEKFKEDFTLEMLTNYILEFNRCFNEIISIEELIRRIMNNVKGDFVIREKIESKSNIRRT